MSKTTLITSEHPKYAQTASIFEAAYNQCGLNEEQAQRLNEKGGALKSGLQILIRQITGASIFTNEEVTSSYVYPSGYTGARFITEQTNRLRQMFSGIGFADEKLVERPLPSTMEGYFAIPRWETIAKTYGEAVETVLAKIKETRPIYNYRDGQLGAKYLRQHERSIAFWQKLSESQKGYDILVVPAQFGLRHRGKSVRRARETFQANEFGLGAFATGIMLLTHPERIVSYNDLWVDCAGDEYAPKADGSFVSAPSWSFDFHEGLNFDTSNVACVSEGSGFTSTVLLE